MTPEGKVKEQVKKVLKSFGDALYYHCPVQNGMGSPTLDFICCYQGRYFAVETKAPGKVVTPRQEITVQTMRRAGALVFVIDGDMTDLTVWLNDVGLRHAPT